MNKQYKIIWSKVKHCYVVVSELAKNNGKAASSHSKVGQKISVALSVLALCSGVLSLDVQAVDNSKGENFVQGTGSSAERANNSNYIIGTNSSAAGDSASNVLLGDGRRVNNSQFNVIIGSASDRNTITTGRNRVVVVGYNTHSKFNDGVAIGSNSVANTDAGIVGYDPFSTNPDKSSTDNSAVWKSTLAAVSVGVSQETVDEYATDPTVSNKVQTRQITNVAAGTKDTDAVNIAQFKRVAEIVPHYVSVSDVKGESLSNYNNDGATKEASVVIGAGATTTGPKSIVLGYKAAVVDGSDFSGQIAIGHQAKSTGDNALAIGTEAEAEAGIAIGDYSNSKTATAVALGERSKANNQGSVSIGHMTSSEFRGVAIGQNAGSQQDNSTALGSYARANTKDSLASGYKAGTYSGGSVAIGSYASVFANTDTPKSGVEYNNLSDDEKKQYAPGLSTIDNEEGSRQYYKLADSGYGTAVGYSAIVKGQGGLALGNAALSDVTDGVAIGKNSYAHVESGVALGASSRATTEADVRGYDPSTGIDSIKDTPTWKSTLGAVSVGVVGADGEATQTRQITGVAAGTNLTDAVNVAQLKAARVKIEADTDEANSVTVSPSTADDGSTIYTISGVDTNTTITKGEITYNGSAGKLVLTDSNDKTLEITGLRDLDTTGVTLNGDTLTFTRNDGTTYTVGGLATATDLAANKIHYYSVNAPKDPTKPGGNYKNDGATGDNALAAGVGASAVAHNSIAIGNKAVTGAQGSGSIALGDEAKVENYANRSGGIAIGQKAHVENMAGTQESLFSLGQANIATGIAIGKDTYARTGSLMIGTHEYKGKLGDVEVDSSNTKDTGININATTIGTNSYNSGAFATVTGAYSIVSSNYNGGFWDSANAAKNFGATVVGSLNSIESATANNYYSGIANSVVGVANRTFNSNGSLIFGAGNEITNSVTDISVPGMSIEDLLLNGSAANSAKELQDKLKQAVQDSNSGGATLAIGGGNKADYTRASSIIGVNNTLTGADGAISEYNSIMGYNNKADKVNNVTVAGVNNTISNTTSAVVLGDNHKVTGANNSIVIGSADKETELTATDATVIGHNANTSISTAVALGSGSVAAVDKGVSGYIPTGKTLSGDEQAGATWKSTLGAVSVGVVGADGKATQTRQITGVAAGKEATDAVNVAQLQAVVTAVSDAAAAGHTAITLNGKAVTKDNPTVTDNNLTLAIKTDDKGKDTYDIKLSDKLTIGTKGEPGKDGEDGQPGTPGKAGTPGSITIIGENGKDAQGNELPEGNNTSANISVKDGANGLDGKDGVTRIVYTDEGGKEYQVATMDDGLNFIGDTANVTVSKKLNETLSITGGIKEETKLSDNNIGVVAQENGGLTVKLAKELTGLTSANIGGVTINNDGINMGDKRITNVASGIVKGDDTDNKNAANIGDVKNLVTTQVNGSKAQSGKNITVADDNKVNLNDKITLGSETDTAKQVTVDGNGAKVTAGDGTNKVVVDGSKGQVVIGDGTDKVTIGNQYITGLDNTTWNPGDNGENVVVDRAATEGQLQQAIKNVSDTVAAEHTAITLNGKEVKPGIDKLGVPVQDNNLELAAKIENGKTTYDIKMSKDLVLGTKGEPGKDGEDGQPGTPGKAGTPGSITIIGENGKDAQGNELPEGNNTSANISVKDGAKGLDGKDGVTRIVYLDETGKVTHEVATMDDGLNFAGDDAKTISKKLNEQLDIKGGADTQKLSDNNIGVVSETKDGKTYLSVKLGKELTGLTSANIGGVTINNDGINMGDKRITNVASGIVKGDDTDNKNAANIGDVKDLVTTQVNGSKAQSGKNITVADDNKVNLNDKITLGSETDTAKQVTVDGNGAKVTAGDGTNKVVVDGSKGQVVIGDGTDKVTIGNQYITGLDNTTWNPGDNGENVVADRAATEGQLHVVADQIKNINTSIGNGDRNFAGDTGTATAKLGQTINIKGGATELSDNNIGVVANGNELDIKLSKDLKGLNSVTTKELTVTEKANIGDVTIEGDTITVGKGDSQTIINGEGISIPGKDGKDGVNISGEGIDMGGNPITNVGEAVNPGDAINKGYFDKNINNITNGMGQMSNRISKLDRRVDRVGAGAAALAALHPLEFSPEAKWEVSAGVGNYKGANAVAIGAFYRPNGDTMFSIGTSLGGGENMVNAGVTLRVGDGETENYPARKVMAQQIKDLQSVVNTQNEKIEQLTQLVNTLVGANQQIQPVVSAPQAQADAEEAQQA